MKRTREDEPSKARRGWQRGRGRPPKNGDASTAAPAKKRSSRSVFGPSGEDRPDVLTDAETVVLPVWLHRRPSSGGAAAAEDAAAFLKSLSVPAQTGEAPGAEPDTGEPPATDVEAEGKAAPQTAPETGATAEAEALSGPGEASTAAGPADGQLAEAAQDDTARAGSAEAKTGEAGPETGSEAAGAAPATAGTEATTEADPKTQPGTEAGAEAAAEATTEADPKTQPGTETGTGGDAEPGPQADAEAIAADAQGAGTNGAEAEARSQDKAGVEPDAPAAGDAAPRPAAGHPDSETIITINLADLRAAAREAQAPADQAKTHPATPQAQPAPAGAPQATAETKAQDSQAKTDQVTTVPAKPVPGQARPGQAAPPKTTEATTAQSTSTPATSTPASAAPASTDQFTTVQFTAAQFAAVQATTMQARTIEAIEAIDALETRTIDGLEARTAHALDTVEAIEAIKAKTARAMETIEAMTANALQAIDTTAAEIAATATGEPGQAETPRPERPDSARPDRAGTAGPSPGTDLAQPHVIRIDEPPASVTLTTSATETTIALPHPRAKTTVAVAPSPAVNVGTATPVVQPAPPSEPAALPPAEPGPHAEPEAEPPYTTTRRRTRVSRFLLLCMLGFQALISLRLHNTAYLDEAQYLYSGHLELQHLLHGTPLGQNFNSLYSGSPVLYPVLAAAVDQVGGLTAARMLSLAEMLSVTALLYSLTRLLFNERVALCAALVFCVTEPAIFMGNFATYDATSLFLLASAAWIMVRTAAFRWPVFLAAAPVAALAVGVKYAGLLFVPTIAVLPPLARWPLRSRRVLLYPVAFAAVVGGLLYAGLRLGGHSYVTAISSTTTNRAHGATPLTTLVRETALWGGVIFVLALIGTAAYVWRSYTEPGEVAAPAGSRFRRLCLGVVLTGTALLAPAYQAHLHTDVSFQKHVGFGLFFAAPMAGLGMVRLLGDHFRRPHIAVGIWCVALALGLVQAGQLYQSWPNSTQFVRAFSANLAPHGRYLVEEPAVPIYYLQGHPDAQAAQFSSTFYIRYRNRKGVFLTGTPGYTAAVDAGYFHIVAYYGGVTPAVDAALGRALADSKLYYLAAQINLNNPLAPGEYFVWVKGHPAKPSGVFVHASSKYQDLGTKLRELAP